MWSIPVSLGIMFCVIVLPLLIDYYCEWKENKKNGNSGTGK